MSSDLAKPRATSAKAGSGKSRALAEDLKAIGWSPEWKQSTTDLAKTVEALIGELAVLSEIADGNRAAQTDREGRYRDVHSPMPTFEASGAQEALDEAEKRLWQEYEKLAGKARQPARPERPKCASCRRRVRLLDEYCGPCGSEILAKHRRG